MLHFSARASFGSTLVACALAATCHSMAARIARADDPTPTPKQPPAEIRQEDESTALQNAAPAIQEQTKRIEEELKALSKQNDLPADHWSRQWAGVYYVGDGLGMNVSLTLAPKAGITYTWHGCLGLYDGNRGDIEGTFDDDGDGKADGLKIKWALHLKGGYGFGSDKYYFVRWAGPAGSKGRNYLVPESKMLDVVNHYNEGGFARNGMYSAPLKYDAAGGENAHRGGDVVEGVPQLPPKWARMLITTPLVAKVTAVTKPATGKVTPGVEVTEARVTLDKGRADGVYIGMTISVGDLGLGGSLEVDKVSDHTAEAKFRAFTSEGKGATPPAVGQTVRMAEGAIKPAPATPTKP